MKAQSILQSMATFYRQTAARIEEQMNAIEAIRKDLEEMEELHRSLKGMIINKAIHGERREALRLATVEVNMLKNLKCLVKCMQTLREEASHETKA